MASVNSTVEGRPKITFQRLSPTSMKSQCGSSNCAIRAVYAVSMTMGCSVFPLAWRARMAGTVNLFMGAGVGLAREVDVSMVKVVDMSKAIACQALFRQL